MHQDYLTIFEMNAPINIKALMLGGLLSCNPDTWRVVGITEEALLVFKEHNFKKVSRMGINRSHQVDRIETYTEMLTNKMIDIDSWWSFYSKNDTTILSTSSENMSKDGKKIIDIDTKLGLFKSQGFAWRHGKEEVLFLNNLYNDTLSATKASEHFTNLMQGDRENKHTLASKLKGVSFLAVPVKPILDIKNVWLFNISNSIERDNKNPFDATAGDWIVGKDHCQIRENEPQYAIGLCHGVSRVVIQISKWIPVQDDKVAIAGDNIAESEIGKQLLEKDFSRIIADVGFWQRGRPIRVNLKREEFTITYGVKDGRSGKYLA